MILNETEKKLIELINRNASYIEISTAFNWSIKDCLYYEKQLLKKLAGRID